MGHTGTQAKEATVGGRVEFRVEGESPQNFLVFFAKVNPNGTSQTCPMCLEETGKKELSQRTHECHFCGYKTDRGHAAAEVVRERGLELISTLGLRGMETACAVGLSGLEETQRRKEAKPDSRKGGRRTRNTLS